MDDHEWEKFVNKPDRLDHLVVALLAVLIFGLLFWSIVVEPQQLFVNAIDLFLPQWPSELNGMRVALIADLHVASLYVDNNKVRQVVNETNATNPDLILLLGDYIATDRHHQARVDPVSFSGELSHLKAKSGVFAVLGNHDWWAGGTGCLDCMKKAHIPVLENSAVPVQYHGKRVWIAGIADFWTRKPAIQKTLDGIPAGEPVIFMTHNPDIFPNVPPRVALTVAGHTHGGQVSIPIIGPVAACSKFGTRFAAGEIVEEGRHLFVSTGIGTSVFPIRFRVPPEIALLVLRKKEEAVPVH